MSRYNWPIKTAQELSNGHADQWVAIIVGLGLLFVMGWLANDVLEANISKLFKDFKKLNNQFVDVCKRINNLPDFEGMQERIEELEGQVSTLAGGAFWPAADGDIALTDMSDCHLELARLRAEKDSCGELGHLAEFIRQEQKHRETDRDWAKRKGFFHPHNEMLRLSEEVRRMQGYARKMGGNNS